MDQLKTHSIGIIMNGVTGRMGTNQHLLRSIGAIIKQGGVKLSPSEVIMPDPILVGRNPVKLETLAAQAGLRRWTSDLDAALADDANAIYFDAQTTERRVAGVKKAIAAGKHIYC
ncbi:gfo/Idh/MocA family oxidoreductase, partial [bacterium]|nr:gfo/Idh/MocA family oxidoreductase [bacterium]